MARRQIAAGHVQSLPVCASCMGGHGASPYEQNTQQSPGFGCSNTPHAGQSQKNWQASVGMRAVVAAPQAGQVIVASGCSAGASAVDAPV